MKSKWGDKKMEVYIGGNVKSLAERKFLEEIDKTCRNIGIKTFLPHRDAIIPGKSGEERGLLTREEYLNPEIRKLIFEQDIKPLEKCDVAIMVLDGLCWGTTMELGYVYALKRKLGRKVTIIGVFTDPRGFEMLDCMRAESCDFLVSSIEELVKILKRLKEGQNGY